MSQTTKTFWDNRTGNPNINFGITDHSIPRCYSCGIYPAVPYDEDFYCSKCREKVWEKKYGKKLVQD